MSRHRFNGHDWTAVPWNDRADVVGELLFEAAHGGHGDDAGGQICFVEDAGGVNDSIEVTTGRDER